MSKCPEELKMFLNMIGVDPESVEIQMLEPEKAEEAMGCACTPSEFLERIMSGAKTAGAQMKNVARDMSDDAMRAHLSRNGFSEERINEIMKETEENRKREAEAAEAAKKSKAAVESNVVFMTLKSIADAHGYKLTEAVVKDGVPTAKIEVNKTGVQVGAPEIVFSAQHGFGVSTSGTYAGEGMDMMLSNVQKAVACCKSLNHIDWRTWPTVE